jgi:hypothetical protein
VVAQVKPQDGAPAVGQDLRVAGGLSLDEVAEGEVPAWYRQSSYGSAVICR